MHSAQFEQLKTDLASGNLSHAYLFVGREGIGKFELALSFAEFLQEGSPKNLDTIVLGDNGDSIKVEEVRSLVNRVNLTSQSPYKAVLIQNVERMTVPAANAFLKTLEEPPDRTVFVLTASGLSLVLPTIVSRTRVVRFSSSKEICGDPVEIEEIQGLLQRSNLVDRFEYVDTLVKEEGDQKERFLNLLLIIFRKRLRGGWGGSSSKTIKALLKIEEAGILLKQNVNSRLVLENLMLNL